MKGSSRFVVSGAVLGAILGALGGWLYGRRSDTRAVALTEVDRTKLFHLGTSFVALLRQIIELSAR